MTDCMSKEVPPDRTKLVVVVNLIATRLNPVPLNVGNITRFESGPT